LSAAKPFPRLLAIAKPNTDGKPFENSDKR
jgi:hypothetical protein